MAYAVQRSYNKHGRDYLHAWCDKWGTSCMISKKMAMTFDTEAEAAAAAQKAQAVCKGADGKPAVGHTFTPVAI